MQPPSDDRTTDTISRSLDQGERPNNGDGSLESEATFKRGQDWSTLGTLLLLTIAGGLLIVLYVAIVNLFTAQRKESDAVENAAILAAHELSQITVQHSSFGEVGLCDLPPGRLVAHGNSQCRASSIDALYETLRIDADIADELKYPLIQTLVDKDLATAKKLERELAQKLTLAVVPDTAPVPETKQQVRGEEPEDQDNSVYRHVYRMISSDREAQQSSAVELKVLLGRAKSPIISRDCEVRLINPAEFVPADNNHAPYLVLIRATYTKRSKTKGTTNITKQACALIAAPTVQAPPAAFMINFPHGVPPQLHSAIDILKYRLWTNKGDWQQAVGSEVPGKGSLAPPLEQSRASMSPSDAMAVALYHWLKSAGTTVDPERAVELIKSRWDLTALQQAPVERKEDVFDIPDQTQGQANSCLAKDTGAREYSIMNQTGPGSVGQTALCRAFSIVDPLGQNLNQPVFPQSALPLFIDKNGNCNLAGRAGFNRELIQDFLRSVHDTNIAAISSLVLAKQFVAQTNTAISQSEQRVFIEKQELASVTSRLARLEDAARKQVAPSPATKNGEEEEPERIVNLARQRIEALKSSINADELEQKRFVEIQKLAGHATANAMRTATSTFELCTHAFKLCQSIRRLDAPSHCFLLGNKYIFIANTAPLQESDFLDAAEPDNDAAENFTAESGTAGDGNKSKQPAQRPAWFANNMETVVSAETAFENNTDNVTVEGKPLRQVLREPSIIPPFPFGVIILDSRTLNKSAEGQPTAQGYRQYPFANIAIPPGESLYYCENAIKTGQDPEVAWSVLLRDLVASNTIGTSSEGGVFGSAIASQERDWCRTQAGGSCPGLACELQIRCPLPILKNFTEDSYLKNPSTDGQIPQVPPVPPDML